MLPRALRRQTFFLLINNLMLGISSPELPKRFPSNAQLTSRLILRPANVSCTTVPETTLVWPSLPVTRLLSTPGERFTSLTISRNIGRQLERVLGTALSRWPMSSETTKSRSASSHQRLREVRVFSPQLSHERYRLIRLR